MKRRELTGGSEGESPSPATDSQVEGLYSLLDGNIPFLPLTMPRCAGSQPSWMKANVSSFLEWGIPAWPHRIFSFGSCAWGLWIQAVTDSQLIQITSALVGPGDLVLAFTMSGRTAEIMGGLQMAKARGARTVLFTGGQRPEKGTNAPDEVVHLLSPA